MARKPKKTKYVKALFTVPNQTYLEFKKIVPEGERSQIIAIFMKKYVSQNLPKKKTKSPWEKIQNSIKGDYSHEDPVKLAHDAWNDVD